MITTYYSYDIEGYPGKGIYVSETDCNWLHVVDDSLKRKFFILSDIEKELGITLTLRKKVEVSKHIYN